MNVDNKTGGDVKTFLVIVTTILLWSGIVWADGCTTNTVFSPDGTMQICHTCCYGGSCNTICT